MTKSELIEQVAEKIEGLTKKQTEIIVNEILESIKNALASSDNPRVEIRGFGSFKVKQRRSREGRNPKTGTQVSIDAKKVPIFKAGKELRERVDSGHKE
jgi:integration host factor subunit beta